MLSGFTTSFEEPSILMGDYAQSDRSMTLTKQFRGLELSQPVRLLEARPERATLQATNPTLVPLLEGSVTLHSQAFSTSIVGRVKNMNYTDGIFHLADFSVQDWKQRQSERVQPKEPTYITLRCRQKEARLCLEDISTIGMGVFAGSDIHRSFRVQPGLMVHLDFQVFLYLFENLEGRILYFHRVGQSVEKLGLRLYPSSKQRRSLEQYIAFRRQEILDEVSQIYSQRLEPHGIEYQYF